VTSHPLRTVPELVAEEPERVWSHDATALRMPRRGRWDDLFVMLDIFSRCAPGWLVVECQNSHVVRDRIEAVVTAHAIPEARSPSMTTVARR
jgi:putative transposase